MNGKRIAAGVGIVVGVWALAVVLAEPTSDEGVEPSLAGGPRLPSAVTPDPGTAPVPRNRFTVHPAHPPTPVQVRLRPPPRAGLLFDVRTGEVLWQLHPRRRLPIASLTKMITGLIVARRHRLRERVLITRETLNYEGSGVGVLPRGKKVKLGALLHGLLLVSGNDAAIALAQHDARTVGGFVRRMNVSARALGLACSHFSSPSGIKDRRNYSCPLDLATLARLDLANPIVGRIIGMQRARFRFPVKGGFLDLYNNNPFIDDPRVTGVKTGLTDAAGRCYVTTARLAGRHLGVVLLDTPDPLRQVPRLLRAGARSPG